MKLRCYKMLLLLSLGETIGKAEYKVQNLFHANLA